MNNYSQIIARERRYSMIFQAKQSNAKDVATLALKLWPDNKLQQFEQEFTMLLDDHNAAIFLAVNDGELIGFAQCQLRHDYVEGTDSSPVGYLEGLYVVESHVRQQGYAKQLVAACEQWSKAQGCKEMGSDCELFNETSIVMHERLGFQEVNRIVCFTKKL